MWQFTLQIMVGFWTTKDKKDWLRSKFTGTEGLELLAVEISVGMLWICVSAPCFALCYTSVLRFSSATDNK